MHLGGDSINWYGFIANASDELREQIRQMRRDGISPRDFGLYVEHLSDSLLITAANKMRDGETVILNQNFTGKLVESSTLPTNRKTNEDNEELIKEYWKSGFGRSVTPTEKGWFIHDVDVEQIESFIVRFRAHRKFAPTKSHALTYLQAISDKFDRKGDVLLVSKGPGIPEEFVLGAQDRTAEGAKDGEWLLAGYRLASRGDEKLGLTSDQVADAIRVASGDEKSKTKKTSDLHYRMVRNKPLLMIHVLEPTDVAVQALAGQRVPAFGISFPHGLFGIETKVVANRVWIEQMYRSFEDDPDSEDDFDE